MNLRFLQLIDDYLYGWWQMLTIPALCIACFWAFFFLPVIAVGLGILFASICFKEAGDNKRWFQATKDTDYQSLMRHSITTGTIIAVTSTVMFVGLTYFTLHDKSALCRDTSSDIPLTLPTIVRFFYPSAC